MATPENTFIRGVHSFLPKNVYHMKNHNAYVGGVADCWYSGKGGDLWIEYKHIVVPKRMSTEISLVKDKNPMLSALQQQWLADRYAEGRRVVVVVGSAQGGVWMSTPDVWGTPMLAGDFLKFACPRKAIAEHIASLTI